MTGKKEIELAASLPEWKEKYNFRSYLIFDEKFCLDLDCIWSIRNGFFFLWIWEIVLILPRVRTFLYNGIMNIKFMPLLLHEFIVSLRRKSTWNLFFLLTYVCNRRPYVRVISCDYVGSDPCSFVILFPIC